MVKSRLVESELTTPLTDSGGVVVSSNMSDEEIVVRITQDLKSIRDALHELTPLQSRWNGSVRLDTSIEKNANALFQSDGTIVVAPRLIYRKARWRTLIHEMIHSLGVPVSLEDYNEEKGWEEGFVEYAQRQLRPMVMARLGVLYDEEFIQQLEPTWLLQPYVEAVETIVAAIGENGLEICWEILQQPLKKRAAFLILKHRAQARILSKQSADLRTKILSGTMSKEDQRLWNEEEAS